MFTEALSCRLFVFSPLVCETIPSWTTENTVFVFRIFIYMFLFAPLWIVDVKYLFCSLNVSLKWARYLYSQGKVPPDH